MRLLARFAAASLAFIAFSAFAQDTEKVKADLKKKFPDAPIEAVRKVPYGNLYEVLGGGEILYTDAATTFLIVGGSLVDSKTRENVTELRMRQVNAIAFDSLPFESSIKIVRGKGTRRLAIFEDPNCGYCKRLERDLAGIPDLTLYVFLYPILSPDSTEKSKAVWCSSDRAQAWLDLMLKDQRPMAGPNCDTPIDRLLAFGRDKRIQGTPTIIFEDGERAPGALPVAQIEARIAQAAKPAGAKSATK